MKRNRLATLLCTALLATNLPTVSTALDDGVAKQVTVLGRDWVVSTAEEAPGFYRATRLNTELLPFRPPAVLSVRQALKAFHLATGCSASRDTIYRRISGSYYATLICPKS